MKIRDTRHHSTTCIEDEASKLLDELAEGAYMWTYQCGPSHLPCSKEDCPTHTPGWVINRQSEEKRKILRKLKSD